MTRSRLDAVGRRAAEKRDAALARPAHDDRTAALLGIALGCHVHRLLPDRPLLPPAPAAADLDRGAALAGRPVPRHPGPARGDGHRVDPAAARQAVVGLPRLFAWPPFRSLGQLIERLALVVLVAGSLFMLFSGTANIERWYPWRFFFPAGHYWAAWITIGALVVHIGAKLPVVRRVLSRGPVDEEPAAAEPGALTRRGFLGATAAATGLLTLFTVGQTVGPLRRLVLFAPRRPDIGPQGLPVNATAGEAGVLDAATLRRLPARGSPAPATDLVAHPGRPRGDGAHPGRAPDRLRRGLERLGPVGRGARRCPARRGGRRARASGVTVDVRSLERNGLYGQSVLAGDQVWADDTLLALTIDDEDLHVDHGFPCRLIAGNRPGVLQTKWVGELVVR